MNVDPKFGSLLTLLLPSICRANFQAMVRPSPDPSCRRLGVLSTRRKASKMSEFLVYTPSMVAVLAQDVVVLLRTGFISGWPTNGTP